MNLYVYKGFLKEFLKEISIKPLIESDEKYNIFCLDSDYQNKITKSIFGMQDSWITYEEFELAYDFLMLFVNNGTLKITICDNNIYPGMYPSFLKITDDLYSEYEKQLEFSKKSSNSQELNTLTKFYSDI